MMAPRWRKAIRDVLGRPGRSVLAVVAMAAGVFEIGAMLYKYALLQPELTSMYGRTHPASAVLLTDDASDSLLEAVRRVPGVADAEARPVILARARLGQDEWVPALLYVVRDFEHQRIDTFEHEAGAWPPGDGEVLLERSGLSVARVQPGGALTVRMEGREDLTLRVAGTVHAAGLAPAWMEHMVPGFVSWTSVARSGAAESAQLRIVVADHPLDEGYIREVADSVRTMLERRGHEVTRIQVPTPGRHPHADQMEAFLFLLLSFGILSFALSAVLVASMIQALMGEQVRQVAIMKAIGATSRQITGVYLAEVSILAAGSLLVGIPAGIVVGRAYAQFAAGILNANITHRPFPVWLIVAEVAVGILVPLLVAMVPVARAARITVHEALADTPGGRSYRSGGLDGWLSSIAWLPRPLALSLRTTFTRRGRLALTVGTLAVGGAVFMAALNVGAAWTRTVDADFRVRRYDLTVSLADAHPVAALSQLLAGVPGVEHAEYWPGANPYLIGPSGVPGNTVGLLGLEPGSTLLGFPLVAGRWLRPGDRGEAVINRAVLERNPALGIGKPVTVRLDGRDVSFPVVGVVRELSPMPVIYAAQAAVLEATGRPAGMARTVRIVTRGHGDAAQRETARRLERAFEQAGIEVLGIQRMADARQGILDHLVIIMAVLTMASVIVVFVGALGLTSTLMLNVVQRTREIGVLGAIGAGPGTIARQIWAEAVAIGLLSWGVAMLLSVPISDVLEATAGNIFFRYRLDFYLSPIAALTWLGLVVVLASISSFYPARRAARLPIREALSYT